MEEFSLWRFRFCESKSALVRSHFVSRRLLKCTNRRARSRSCLNQERILQEFEIPIQFFLFPKIEYLSKFRIPVLYPYNLFDQPVLLQFSSFQKSPDYFSHSNLKQFIRDTRTGNFDLNGNEPWLMVYLEFVFEVVILVAHAFLRFWPVRW